MARLARSDLGTDTTYARELKIHSLRYLKDNPRGLTRSSVCRGRIPGTSVPLSPRTICFRAGSTTALILFPVLTGSPLLEILEREIQCLSASWRSVGRSGRASYSSLTPVQSS